MKKIFFSMTAIAALAMMSFSFGDVLPIGSNMPKADVKMKDISGKEVTMESAKKANGVLVMFSCNTCPYVIKNQERTLAIGKYVSTKDVGIIILNSNEAQRKIGRASCRERV